MLSSGKIIDGYQLLRRIGKGGFGEVWLAKVGATSEFRALKWIPASTGEHLQKELEAVKVYRSKVTQIGCRSLLPIEHVGRDQTGFYYILPLADALVGGNPADQDWQPKTLANLIETRRQAPEWFSSREIVEMFLPIVEAAEALSQAGLLHRDIKPANIIFHEGLPCLCDVGLVGLDTPTLSHLGTPGFSAPSWYLETGGNPDLWGLACTLFTLLSGHNPDKLGRGNYLWPQQEISVAQRSHWPDMHKLIHRATSAKASERFLRIGDFGDALAGCLQRTRREKRPLLYPLILGCTVVVAGTAVWKNFQTAKNPAPEAGDGRARLLPSLNTTPEMQARREPRPPMEAEQGADAASVVRQKVAEFNSLKNAIVAQSIQELEQSAGQGDAEAMFTLGFLYAKGETVAKDRSLALKWFRKSFMAGNSQGAIAMEALECPEETMSPAAKRLRALFSP